MNYNKLLNDTDTEASGTDSDNETNDIRQLYDTQHTSATILNDILQHPYIDKIPFNMDEITTYRDKLHLIVYRINNYNGHYVVEFHIIDDFISISMKQLDDPLKVVTSTLIKLQGSKRIKGHLKMEGLDYLFIQVRDNNDTDNWMTIGDIIVNKHYFEREINPHVIHFFVRNCEISNLMRGSSSTVYSNPIILYTNIEDKHVEYVKKSRSIQYCQRENGPLIRLRKFKKNDNIRTICFVDDVEFSDAYSKLAGHNYIIMNADEKPDTEGPIWIFKNEMDIFSNVKA
jgi:hypothetical protein